VKFVYQWVLFLLFVPQLALGFDHSYKEWGAFLKTHVSYSGLGSRVDYTLLRQHPAQLDLLLYNFSETPKKEFDQFSRDQQIAFLINGYNAYSIKLVLERYPIYSFDESAPDSHSPYAKPFIALFDQKLSLDDLEHKWLMGKYEDLRVLFAVNCLCISCPNLAKQPYLASQLDRQLERSIELFLSDGFKNQIRRHHLFLSELIDLRERYFELADGSIEPFFKKRWPKAAKLIAEGRFSYRKKDNALNDLLTP